MSIKVEIQHSGNIFAIECPSLTTVGLIKRMIHEQTKLPIESIRLMVNDV